MLWVYKPAWAMALATTPACAWPAQGRRRQRWRLRRPAWDITYDMTGSIFDIRDTPFNAGNQTNTLQMPYDADTNWGPGTMVIRFVDAGGSPGDGGAHIMSYTATQNFRVVSAATVHTMLEVAALPLPDQCGAADGTLAGTTVSWGTDLRNYRSVGTITCDGVGCSLGGLPPSRDQDETGDQPLNSFEFSGDLSSFTMAEVTVPNDDQATTWLTFVGTEVSRVQSCACE